jgi:phospholipase/carboxylesterase
VHLINEHDRVCLEPDGVADAAVIWLHGLGADGHDFVPVVGALRLPPGANIRFVFPHAPQRPVTINGGYPLRAWYDIYGLSDGSPEDTTGIRESAASVAALIEAQSAAGIAPQRTVVAGFSQGGAIALHTALRHPQRLAGLIALSTYLPMHTTVAAEASAANRDLPILLAHGRFDPIVPFRWGENTHAELARLGYPVQWQAYPMQHEVCDDEIDAIATFLRQVLPA